jgi:hypothetical protein
MRRLYRAAMVGIAGILSTVVVLSPSGYLNSVLAQAAGFIETFDGVPAAPAAYTNPNNWDIFVQGFNQNETGNTVPGGDPRGANLAQHGPNCEPPGFPYNASNSHVMQSAADTVFICNGHVMTSPGLSGYGAIYMMPPAVADFSQGPATISWDMSTLRTSGRDWVDVVLTPWDQQSQMAYNNNDQHIPPNNIHITLAGTNVFLGYERIGGGIQYNQGVDTLINGDTSTTWDQVFQAQNPPLTESPSRRDKFQITLTRTTISVCMPGYAYQGQSQFCWIRNAQLPQPLDPAVWHDQATVQFDDRVYNAEKACGVSTEDQFNIDHTAYGELTCPNNTWHWDNISIAPYRPFSVTKSVPENFAVHSGNPTTVTFQNPAAAGSYLAFVQFSHTPDLRVSYDGGATWHAPHIQPSIAPNNGASEENGEAVFDAIPAGVQSIMVRGTNGFWGTFEAEAFHLIGPVSGAAPASNPISTPTATAPAPTSTPVATNPTATPPSASSGVQSVMGFDNLANPNRPLTGQYGSADWGNGPWYLSGPYDHFTSNSVSFNGGTLRSATIAVASPSRLIQVDADNGGSTSSTVSLACAGQPTAQTTLAPGQTATIRTGWSASCPNVTVSSTNGWDTNFDNFVVDNAGTAPAPTNTPVAAPTNTPVAAPTNTPLPVAGVRTVIFDDLPGQDHELNGQYPTALIDWGQHNWYLAAPFRKFTTKSISFNGAGPTSESFAFVGAHRLVALDAFNDSPASATITISCSGQPTVTTTLAANQVLTINTGWTTNCATVTITSSNGWVTNFDNLKVQ